MKNIILLIICLLFVELIWAQKPEPILSFATYVKESTYYKKQAGLWKKETETNPQNAFAWFNYYRATRNLVRTDTSDHRGQEEKHQQQADIVNEMEKVVPNTYEYNLAKWMHHGQNFAYLKHLKKADELGSGRTEHLSDMAGWGEIERDKEKKDKYCKLWLENGLVSPGLMYYNYNTLIGLKPNAILLTFGDNDTYPAWLLQAKGIRTDVTVINAYLILIDDYRNKVFKELGVSHTPFVALDTVDAEKDYYWFRKDQHLAEDIVQEVFIKLIEQPEQFNPSMRFSTWVFTLTANRCKNNLRNTQNRSLLIANHLKHETFELNSQHDLASLQQRLSQGIDHLNLKEKTIYKLRFEEEMSLKEISETTEIPIGSVKSSLFHLLKKLSKELINYIHE